MVAPHYFLKALEKLKRQLAEADAAVAASKKPPEDAGPRIIGEGLVIDEWVSYLINSFVNLNCKTITDVIYYIHFHLFLCVQKERRERYLAKQQVEGVDSV